MGVAPLDLKVGNFPVQWFEAAHPDVWSVFYLKEKKNAPAHSMIELNGAMLFFEA